jgi:hypothetical protein
VSSTERNLKERAREELRNYAAIVAYLYVCFAAVFFYRAALLQDAGPGFLPHGVALVKALILGKFFMLGEAAKVGTRVGGRSIWGAIATKSLLFFLLLVALSVLEELVAGKIHGRSFAQSLAEIEQRSVRETLATCLLLLLVLIPLIGVKELSRAMGPGELARLLKSSVPGRAG